MYADSLSDALGNYTHATSLVGYSGVGQTSNTSVTYSDSTGISGQTVDFNGQPAFTIAADSSNPPAGNVVQNSTGNSLAVFRFSETSDVENVKVTQMNVIDEVASNAVKASFSNVTLWNGSTLLGTAAAPGTYDSAQGGWDYDFNSLSNLIVPQGNSVSLTLKGDAGSVTNGSLSDNTTSTFEVTNVGGSSATTATSSLTVSFPNALSTATYSVNVTANGVTTPYGSVSLSNGSTTLQQETQVAAEMATLATASDTALGLSGTQTSAANVVTLTSAGTASMNASGAIWTLGTVTTAVNNVGSAGTVSVSIVARGATSNKTAIVTVSSANGNPQTTLRTLVTVAASPVTGTPPNGIQQIGSVTFTANSAGDAVLNNLMLTFNTASTSFLNTVKLKDPSGNDIYLTDGFATSSVNSNTVTWAFATSTKPVVVTAGSSYTLTLWGDLGPDRYYS